LRIVIDGRSPDYIIDHLEFMNEDEEYKINRSIGGREIPPDNFFVWEIFNFLVNNDNYRFSHDIRNGLYVEDKLRGRDKSFTTVKTKIIRFIGDVDIWDLYRIRDGLGISSPEDRYINIKD